MKKIIIRGQIDMWKHVTKRIPLSLNIDKLAQTFHIIANWTRHYLHYNSRMSNNYLMITPEKLKQCKVVSFCRYPLLFSDYQKNTSYPLILGCTTNAWWSHLKSTNNAQLCLHQTIWRRNERLGGKADQYARHLRCLVTFNLSLLR